VSGILTLTIHYIPDQVMCESWTNPTGQAHSLVNTGSAALGSVGEVKLRPMVTCSTQNGPLVNLETINGFCQISGYQERLICFSSDCDEEEEEDSVLHDHIITMDMAKT
jgi:hypothetical protein